MIQYFSKLFFLLFKFFRLKNNILSLSASFTFLTLNTINRTGSNLRIVILWCILYLSDDSQARKGLREKDVSVFLINETFDIERKITFMRR